MSLGKKLFLGGTPACKTDSVNPFDDGLTSSKALYQFDGNANDTAGNYNATASSGVTYTSGYIGQAATMGGNDSINTNDGGALLGDTWSISFFVKFDNANDYEYIAANWRSNPTPRLTSWYLLKRDSSNSNVLEFNVYGSNGTNSNYKQFIAPVSSAFTSNTWYHIAISFNGLSATDVGMYINGLPVSYTTSTGSGWDGSAQISNTLDTTIGGLANSSGGDNYLDGQIDQVRFFNKAISDAEAVILGNETTDTASDVNVLNDGSGAALYSLDYDASDASGNYDGTATNVTFGVEGKINTGADFTGGGVVAIPNNAIYGNNHSISAWFKLDNTSGYQGIFDFDYNNRIIFRVASSDANEANIGTSGWFAHNINFSANQWYHLVITFSNGNPFKIYVNGSVAYTGGNSSLNAQFGDNNFGAGNAAGVHSVNGNIDQLRIFSKELSASEVSTLYGETACVYTSTTDNNDYPVTNTAYYKLDNNAEDAKGSYDGTESNITYDFGRFGQAAVFNDSAITTSLNIGRTNDFTISFWVKDISDSNYGSYGFKWVAGVYNNDYIPINYNKTTGKILLSVHDGTTALGDLETPALDDNWHHIVFTQDVNVETKLYLDGVLQTSETISHASMTQRRSVSGGTGFYFAQNPANSSNDLRYRGKLDQVRIYNSALDAAAVENLYNEKQAYITKNASDPFGDGSEDLFLELNNNVEDSSDQSNDCSSSCLFTTDSLFGSHSADIVTTTQDSRIVVPSDNDLYHSGGTFTISMWAKTDTAISSNYRTLWGMYERNPDLSGHGAFLVRLNSGKIKVENYNNAWFLKTSDFTPSVDRWYHYCFTVNGGTMEVFIDGSLHATHTGLNIDYTASTSPNPQLTLGGYNQAGSIRSYWDGKLDNIRFFDRALDGDEVFKLYAEVIN